MYGWPRTPASSGMHESYKPGDPYNPERFVDPRDSWRQSSRLEKAYLDQLARERSGK